MGRLSKRRRWVLKHRRSVTILAIIGVFILAITVGLQGNRKESSNSVLSPQTDTISIRWLPDSVTRWHRPVELMAAKYQIDPNLLAIIITMESGGYTKATSHVGAQGLMQVMPATAGDIARKYLASPQTDYDIYNPATNIEFGAAYLSYLRDRLGTSEQGPSWNDTVELVAAGYNGGPGTADKIVNGEQRTNKENISYSRDVVGMWRERNAASSPTYQRWLDRGGSNLVNAAAVEY